LEGNTLRENLTIEICNLINEPFLIIDSFGIVLATNRSAIELLGGRDKLLGRSIREIPELAPLWSGLIRSREKRESLKERLRIVDLEYEASVHHQFDRNGTQYTGILLYEISHYLTIENELLRRNRELMIINTLSGTFISSYDDERIFSDLLEKVLLITDFTIGWIMLSEKDGLILKSHKGISLDLAKKLSEGKVNEIVEEILSERQPLHIFEREELSRYPIFLSELIAFLGMIPLYMGDKLLGVFFLGSRSERVFDFDLASMMSLVGNQVSLILEKVKLFEKTRHLSITDPLTGLYNVRYFYRALNHEIERSQRYDDEFSLLIFDIDDFKRINDTYGHQIGDDVLRELSGIMLQHSRKTDIVSRYGGEEFVLILPRTGKEEAVRIAERICEMIRQNPFRPGNGDDITITVSGGVSTFKEDGATPKELLYGADMALYSAKARGKDRVVCCSKDLTSTYQKEAKK